MSVVPGSFKRVGEKKGPLVIGGAEKKMNEDENFIYIPHPKFRVAGPKDDVQKWFEENKVGEKKSKKPLKLLTLKQLWKRKLSEKLLKEKLKKQKNTRLNLVILELKMTR